MSLQRILVRAPNWIGDQVMAYPFFYFLRKSYPQAHIAVVCSRWVKDIQFRSCVDQVIVLPSPETKRLADRWRALREGGRWVAEQGPWDLGITLTNSLSSALVFWLGKVKIRRGYSADARGWLLNDSVPWDPSPQRHRSDAYLSLLPDGSKASHSGLTFWGEEASNELDEDLPGVLPHFPAQREWGVPAPLEPPTVPYFVIAPGATAESRRWFEESFADLATLIYREKGWHCAVVGGPAESVAAVKIAERSEAPVMDYTAKAPIPYLWKIFQNAQISITNESGLAHVAALCGSRVQVVCGAANPTRTLPIGPGKVKVYFSGVECWPCERNSCPNPPERWLICLRGIQAEAVWKEIQS